MDWSHFFAVMAGVVGTRSFLWMRSYLDAPYRWRCTKCQFKTATSHKEALQAVKVDHNRTFHFSERI